MKIRTHKDLRVWNDAMNTAMIIFQLTKTFPAEERYSLVDQIRRSSRSVAANLSEAWRKRRYKAAFISKLSDSESEACETQTWIEFAFRCGYVPQQQAKDIEMAYERIIGQIVQMLRDSSNWIIG